MKAKSLMEIIETSVFTRRVVELLSDDEYRLLQAALAVNPGLGKVIQHSGGIRKLRWRMPASGKRGGVRVIYYWAVSKETVIMLFIFRKNEQSDLTATQLRQLRRIVMDWFP